MITARPTNFGIRLKRLRQRAGKSRYQLAEFTNLDATYLWRLETGQRRNPTRDTVMKIGLALVQDSVEISMHDVNELLLSAEYAPLLSRGESVPETETDEGLAGDY